MLFYLILNIQYLNKVNRELIMAQEKEFQHWTVDTDNNKFVWLCLDVQQSSANVLSAEVLEEFHNITESLSL